MPVPIPRPNLNTAVPNPSRIPGISPGGRGVNPATGIIGSMPGGMDYLAGIGPAPAGVNLPDIAPIIHLATFGGNRPQETFQQKVARWSASQSPWQQFAARRATQSPVNTQTPYRPIQPGTPTPSSSLVNSVPPPMTLPSGRNVAAPPTSAANLGMPGFINPAGVSSNLPGFNWSTRRMGP